MAENTKVAPRITPDRDSRYMGEAWFKASFSKDPSTQVGAVIVGPDNKPFGSGYNGPSDAIDDNSFSWERPPKDDPDAFSKYDVTRHAERNAIKYCRGADLAGSTIYVTALPCPSCMYEILDQRISRVVYYDFQSNSNSSLQNSVWREKSMKIASMSRIPVRVEQFAGNLHWMSDWIKRLGDLQIFG